MSRRRLSWPRAVFTAAGLAGLAVLGVSPAVATTLRKMDLPELVGAADRVVQARALGNTVYWDPTGTQIFTDTTFEVLAEAKGQGPATLTLTLLGGRIDPVEMLVDGTPVFSAGDEVVLFTANRSDDRSDLVGFTQGVMRVVTELTGDKIAVGEVPLGVAFVQLTAPQPSGVRPSPLSAPLAILLDDVRQIVAGTRTGSTLSATPDTDPVAEGSQIP